MSRAGGWEPFVVEGGAPACSGEGQGTLVVEGDNVGVGTDARRCRSTS